MTAGPFPLEGVRVVELGSAVTVPYVGKLFADMGAAVTKVESPHGDPLRGPTGLDPWFCHLNSGKGSVVADLSATDGRERLEALLSGAHLLLDDHRPAHLDELGLVPTALRSRHPDLVVASFTPFGLDGPWADRPVSEFTLQALVGATDGRGVPGQEPVAVGGRLGDFVAASLPAPAVLAVTLAAVRSGRGAHLDCSQYESMMHAFQTYRPIFDAFAPDYRPARVVEIPSVEPARDGAVGYCCITGQQWQDFCVMIGAEDWVDDAELATFDGRMARRHELWPRIHAFTTERTVDELVELAEAFRIPVGPIGTGDVVADLDHFAARGTFADHPQGFVRPRPPFLFSASATVPPRPAPELDSGPAEATSTGVPPGLPGRVDRPLEGTRVVDLSAFWAGPFSTNLLRVLGAEVVKVESHVRLDGMRWASGLQRDLLWEWSPVYHGANAGKRVCNLDLSTPTGRELLDRLVEDADVIIENFSPRVTEQWGLTWDHIRQRNPRTVFVRMPAFGLDGPWRDRVGFAMTMEQVSGLASRTGRPDEAPMVPRGPVDTIAGMHAAWAVVIALAERERTGRGQLVEVPLIEGALQAAAEQVVRFSADGTVLGRTGNRDPQATLQGLYESIDDDVWVAVTVPDQQAVGALAACVGGDAAAPPETLEPTLAAWVRARPASEAVDRLLAAGVPADACLHFNDTGRSPQHEARRFLEVLDHPVAGAVPYLSHPFLFDGRRIPLGGPAPTLGQHTDEILAEMGVDDDRIEALRDEGIIGDWPAMVPRPGGEDR